MNNILGVPSTNCLCGDTLRLWHLFECFVLNPISIPNRKKMSVKFLFLLADLLPLPWLSQTHIPQKQWFMEQHLYKMLSWYSNTEELWCGLYFDLAASFSSEIECSLPELIKPSQLRIPRTRIYLLFMFTLILNTAMA